MSRNASFLGSGAECSITLPRKRVFPGALVEGYATLTLPRDLAVRNVHLKIVGKEQVHAMVDQVEEAKVSDVPFGTVSQDFVYYREIVTFLGDLLTRPRRSTAGASQPRTPPSDTPAEPNVDTRTEAFAYQETHLANSSFPMSNPPTRHNSVLISLEAAATQQDVVIPAGTYVYPFAFALPEELPPSYATGVHVKNGTQSTSRAQLVYYVKLYLIGPDGKELTTARDDFTVLPMQPSQPNRTFIGCMQHRLRDDGATVEVRFPAAGSACGALCGGSSVNSTTANGKHQLAVRMALKSNWLTLGADRLRVELSLHNKTAKSINGARLTLVQQLTFRTAKADVVTTCNMLSAEARTTVACGERGVVIVESDPLPSASEDVVPTLSTSGMIVQYNVRVELLAGHLIDGTYTFDAVVLSAGADSEMGEPPNGELAFSALPRGHLTRREAYYTVPQNPYVAPQLADVRLTPS